MGLSPESVVLADFDGDTMLDVATADLFGESVSVRLGNGDGTFGDIITTAVSGGPLGMAVGRLNNDANEDLVVSQNDDATVVALLGNGDGTFAVGEPMSVEESPQGVVIAQFDGDGFADIAVATEY